MRLKKCVFFLIGVLALLKIEAAIVETADITHVLEHAKKETLVVFDLDNTLIEPSQVLGSDQWVSHYIEKLQREGHSIQTAIEHVIPCWMEIQKKTDVQLIDSAALGLIQKLKKKRSSLIGLTKRDPALSEHTLEQLKRVKIDFPSHHAMGVEHLFSELNGTLYKDGVIFTGQGIDKGPSLIAYLKKLPKMPAQIVAIDDKVSHLQSLERAAESLGIPFIGIRYSALDEKVKQFDPKIAEIQLRHFSEILSDKQAEHLLLLTEDKQ